MKKLLMLIVCMLSPLFIQAQQKTEYNQKGDEAMSKNDYRDARMWYEEGVAFCDDYSIKQLTAIWLNDVSMRRSMHSLMIKCLNCLTLSATNANDTTAMAQLITYYDEGIGTPKNDELRDSWRNQLEQLRQPVYYPAHVTESVPKQPMTWLVGYAFALEAPYGVTIGGIWDKAGWYVRFKTNFSFLNNTYECDDSSNLFPRPTNASAQYNKSKGMKTNSYMATAGVMFKMTSWLYGSVGLGYGERALLCPFITTDYNTGEKKDVWCYNIDSSHKGVVGEADLIFKHKSYFISVGCNTMNFKYVDLNAGIGMFF